MEPRLRAVFGPRAAARRASDAAQQRSLRLEGRAALRVLLVCDSLGLGGAERHVIGLGSALRRQGHEAAIACSVGGPLTDEARTSGVRVHILADRLVKRRVSLDYARRLTRLVEHGGFDLVHAHMHASAAAAAVACDRTGIPLVITEHTEATWRDERAWQTGRAAFRRAAHVIAVSGSIERRLTDADGVPAHRATVIRNAIPSAGPETGRAVRYPRLVRDGPLFGTVARLVPEKGVECFLRAAATVVREIPRARFVVIGEGPLRAQLEVLAEELGIWRSLSFLGPRVDAPKLIAQLDVLAIPSLSNEGTPLVTLEALSSGVAVVATAVGGIPEQLRGFGRAALVPPGDPEALARTLVKMARAVDASPSRTPHPGDLRLLPRYDVMLQRTEAIYATVSADARRTWRFGAALGRWLAR